MKTNKEKFVELDGKIKLVNQKLDLVIKNHLHHMKKDIDRILYGLQHIVVFFLVVIVANLFAFQVIHRCLRIIFIL